jgi:hypothetical protein
VGPTDEPSVEIQAGAGSSFQVVVVVTAGASSNTCARTVVILHPACGINGPSSVISGSTGNIYMATGTGPGISPAWSITGEGTIIGAAD